MKPKRALLFTIFVALLLCAACGVWLHRERQQYARNRALITALENQDFKTSLALVNAGADTNTRRIPSLAPTLPQLFSQLLHHAPPRANASPTAFMIACGAYWPTETRNSIYFISLDENLPLIQAMLAHGANVHVRERDNRTALHNAVANDRLHTVELLLQHGVDVNAQDAQGNSPLMVTAWNRTPQVAHLLLQHGANVNAQDTAGNSVLSMALLASMNKGLPAELLAHGANPDLPDKNGHSPLMLAQRGGRPDVLRLLMRGAK